jgi:hypothetical protein
LDIVGIFFYQLAQDLDLFLIDRVTIGTSGLDGVVG